jgi:hypothetical protein
MAIKARKTQDNNAFGLFRGAFTTTLTADGNAAISTHTLLSGGTTSNLITGTLGATTLNNAFVGLYEQVDQAGTVMGDEPAVLLVPPKLLKLAIELTDSVLISDSGNNAVNFFRSMLGMQVMSSPYLGANAGGSDTAWFVLSKYHSATRLIRQGIQTALRDWSMSNNRTYLYQGNFREQYFIPDYAGLVGSTGV